MATAKITRRDAEALLAFLPRFEAGEAPFVERWAGADRTDDGAMTMPYPVYPDYVQEFFALAGRECWCDYDYEPAQAAAMVDDDARIAAADLADLRTMLTYLVRGERFCDGFWGQMLKSGRVQAVLRRLQEQAETGLGGLPE